MPRVLHVIDARTGPDMLSQLALLSLESEPIVCQGPTPDCTDVVGPVRSIHVPVTDRCGLTRSLPGRLGEPELLHAWSPWAYPTAAALGRVFRRPTVVSLSCGNGQDVQEATRCGAGARETAITVPTRGARDDLIRKGAAGESVHVLGPAAREPDDPDGRRRRTRESLGLGESECLLVAPAEMTRSAGHSFASWAHAIVRQALPHIRLLFPGGGPIERHVRFFAGTTGYDDEIFFTASRLSLADVLCGADIALFFFRQDVGISLLAAAMAAGLPIAASATPDVSACAPHEEAALLTAAGNPRSASAAVLRLLEEPDLARRLADAARSRAREEFDVASVRARLDEIYAAALFAAPA